MDDASRARAEANRAHALKVRAQKRSRCAECGGVPNATLLENFEVNVCDRHRTPDFDLVPAGEATKQYLLPQSTLRSLRSVDKKNPRGFARPMKLYLRRDLARAATRRYGDNLAEERARREAANWQKRSKRAREFFAPLKN